MPAEIFLYYPCAENLVCQFDEALLPGNVFKILVAYFCQRHIITCLK
jgi:hypothetical protein